MSLKVQFLLFILLIVKCALKINSTKDVEAKFFNHELALEINSRPARSPQLGPNFSPRAQCTVAKDKLIALKNSIDAQFMSSNVSNTNCDSSEEINNCDRAVQLIQCSVDILKNKLNEKSFSYQEMAELHNFVENQKIENEKVSSDMIQSATQEIKTKLDDTNKRFQELLKEFDDKKDKLMLKTKRACISEIRNGNIQSAIASFEELKDNSLLNVIIEESYNSLSDEDRNNEERRINNFDNVIKFIEKLPHIYEHAVAYPTLFNVMKANNHLSSPKMLVLSCMVENLKKKKHFSAISQEDRNKIFALKNCSNYAIEKCAGKIFSGEYERIKKLVQTPGKNPMCFYKFIPSIVRTSYADIVENVENIVKFFCDLFYFQHAASGFTILYDQMKLNNHLESNQLIILANGVKTFLERSDYPQIPQRIKNSFEGLKHKFSGAIQALVFKKSIYIESQFHRGYNLKSDKNGKIILSYPCKKDCLTQKWLAVPVSNGRFYFFQNQANNLTLCSDNEMPKEMMKTDEDKFYWEVIPVENGKYFLLKNKAGGKLSCSFSRIMNRCRTVREGEEEDSNKMKWIIQ